MMKTRKWIIPTELGEINVEYSRGWNDGEYSLTVNGNSHRMQSRAVLYADIDYEFKVADHTLHFVAAGAKCDLAFDGFFLTSKLPYQKHRNLPLSSLILIILQITMLLLDWILPIILVHKIILWAVPCTALTFLTVIMTNMLGKATFARPKDYLPRPVVVTAIELSNLVTILLFYC